MSNAENVNKDLIWQRFISIWDINFKNAVHILHIINSYPRLAALVSKNPLQTESTIINSQREWIRLCSKLSNPVDAGFFKDYWVPIELEEYGTYIDLSDTLYPIFCTGYIWEEPYKWYKRFLFKDIKDLLLSPDIEIDVKGLLKENDKERWEVVRNFFDERLYLGFEGKIKQEELKLEDLICLPKERIVINDYPVRTKESLIIINISSLIVSLLPPDLKIRVVNFISSIPSEIHLPYDKIRKIGDLVFFLRSKGYRSVNTFKVEIQDKDNGVIIYEDNKLLLKTSDEVMINTLVSNYLHQIKDISHK